MRAEAETKSDGADLDDWEAMASDEERGKMMHFDAACRLFESILWRTKLSGVVHTNTKFHPELTQVQEVDQIS